MELVVLDLFMLFQLLVIGYPVVATCPPDLIWGLDEGATSSLSELEWFVVAASTVH